MVNSVQRSSVDKDKLQQIQCNVAQQSLKLMHASIREEPQHATGSFWGYRGKFCPAVHHWQKLITARPLPEMHVNKASNTSTKAYHSTPTARTVAQQELKPMHAPNDKAVMVVMSVVIITAVESALCHTFIAHVLETVMIMVTISAVGTIPLRLCLPCVCRLHR